MSYFGLLRLRISRCSDCSDFLHKKHFFQSKQPKNMLGIRRLQVLPLSTVAEVNCKQLSKFNKKGSKLDLLTSIMSRNLQICFTTSITMLSICFYKSRKYIFFILFYFPPIWTYYMLVYQDLKTTWKSNEFFKGI